MDTHHPLATFRSQLASINDIAFHLTPDSPSGAIHELHEALRIATATIGALIATTSPSATGCTQHPSGPVDPVAPLDWSKCLLCNTARRRGIAQGPQRVSSPYHKARMPKEP